MVTTKAAAKATHSARSADSRDRMREQDEGREAENQVHAAARFTQQKSRGARLSAPRLITIAYFAAAAAAVPRRGGSS